MKPRTTLFRHALLAALLTTGGLTAQAQNVGVGTTAPDASAALDIVATNKGLLLPRVASTGGVPSPATGLIVFQTGAPAGYYYNAGTPATPSWQQIATASGAAITASNGLTKTGQNIALGGPLTQATTIAQAGFALGHTGGNFGIGTATPQNLLDLGSSVGTLPTDVAAKKLAVYQNAAGSDFYGFGITSGLMHVYAQTAATAGPSMTFDGLGRVGIGTTTPTQKLTVVGGVQAASFDAFTAVTATNQGAHLQWNRTGNDGETWLINHMGLGTTNAGIRFAGITTPTGTVPTEWARFLNNGNFGIGTTAPTQKLDVNGNVRIEGLTVAGLVQTDALGNLSSASTASFGTSFIQNQNTADQVANFRINGTGSTLGNFGIGTSAPSQKLEVQGNVFIPSANDYLMRDTNHGMGWYGAGKLWNGVNVDGPVVYGFTGGLLGTNQSGTRTSALSWNSAGNVGIGTTSPSARLHARGTGNAFPATTGTAQSVGLISRFQTSDNAILDLGGNSSSGFWLQSTDITTLGLNYPLLLNPNGGNVGIGTSTPTEKLVVSTSVGSTPNTTNFASVVTVVNPLINSTQGINIIKNDGQVRGFKLYQTGSDDSNSSFRIASTNAGIQSDAFTISRNTGNVGIGTTAPTATLHVAGTTSTVRLEGLTVAGLVQTDASGNLSSASTASFGTSFIQNQNTADQVANFRVNGTGSAGSLQAVGASAAVQTISTQGAYLQWNRTVNDGETWLLNQKGGGTANAGIRFGSATTANAVTEWARFLDNGNFGIGTTNPLATLAVAGAQVLYSGLNNASARPAVGLARIPGEIAGVGQVATATPTLNADDGFLRLSAGGGGTLARKSYIDLSGFSNVADMNENITFGTINTERLRITNTGNVGIGTSAPAAGLHVDTPESGSSTTLGVELSGGTSGNPSIELRGSGKVPYIDFAETAGVDYTTRLISSGGTLNVNNTSATVPALAVAGFTKLSGANGGAAPSIATAKISATMPGAANGQTIVALPAGIVGTKVLSLTAMVYDGNPTTPSAYPPNNGITNVGGIGVAYQVYLFNNQVIINTGNGTTSNGLFGKAINVLITYEQ